MTRMTMNDYDDDGGYDDGDGDDVYDNDNNAILLWFKWIVHWSQNICWILKNMPCISSINAGIDVC